MHSNTQYSLMLKLAFPKGWQNPRAKRSPCPDDSVLVAPSMHTAKAQAPLSWPEILVGNPGAVQQLNTPVPHLPSQGVTL